MYRYVIDLEVNFVIPRSTFVGSSQILHIREET